MSASVVNYSWYDCYVWIRPYFGAHVALFQDNELKADSAARCAGREFYTEGCANQWDYSRICELMDKWIEGNPLEKPENDISLTALNARLESSTANFGRNELVGGEHSERSERSEPTKPNEPSDDAISAAITINGPTFTLNTPYLYPYCNPGYDSVFPYQSYQDYPTVVKPYDPIGVPGTIVFPKIIKTPVTDAIPNVSFLDLAEALAALYARKNSNYGNSFAKSVERYGLVAALTRLSDKFNRVEALILGQKDGVGESLNDTLLDLASYAIMTVLATNDNNVLQQLVASLKG